MRVAKRSLVECMGFIAENCGCRERRPPRLMPPSFCFLQHRGPASPARRVWRPARHVCSFYEVHVGRLSRAVSARKRRSAQACRQNIYRLHRGGRVWRPFPTWFFALTGENCAALGEDAGAPGRIYERKNSVVDGCASKGPPPNMY